MSSIHYSHTLRAARSLGLPSRTGTRFQPGSLGSSLTSSLARHQWQPPKSRTFHFSAAAVAQATQDAVIGLHAASGLPWFAVIPLVAVGVNLIFRLPLNIYTHKLSQQRAKLTPLYSGWAWRINLNVSREGLPKGKEEKVAVKRYEKAVSRLHRSLGLQNWKMYSSLLAIPFWLVGIDSIRRISGGPEGIFGLLFSETPVDAGNSASSSLGATASAVNSSATAPAAQVSAVDTSAATAALTDNIQDLPDPSIALEGCLWFQDLTAADPYCILPFALTVMLVANQLPSTERGIRRLFDLRSKEGRVVITTAAKRSLRFRRALLLLSLIIGPITASMPAALHMYWLTTSASQLFVGRILSYLMPVKNHVVKEYKEKNFDTVRPDPSERPIAQANR